MACPIAGLKASSGKGRDPEAGINTQEKSRIAASGLRQQARLGTH
jgi:hypothetical protein